MNFENLLASQLAGANDTEVVVSRVSVPPRTSLPMHWHPGEEFAYVLEGALILHQQDEDDVKYSQGEAGIVPFKKIHTIETEEEGVTVLVFRVHERGQPERVLVD